MEPSDSGIGLDDSKGNRPISEQNWDKFMKLRATSHCLQSFMSYLTVAVAIVLTMGLYAEGETAAPPEPVFPVRTLYAVGHFGNSYEVMGDNEMRELLSEAKAWGFNRYADWFDTEDCSDPFAQTRLYQLAHAMWERKKANFATAYRLGFACDLAITPNHVYVDQCHKEWAAVQGGRIFGQLICPSNPQARQVILRNYENLFADLARSGVRLSALVAAPYDFGGCACEQCKPWILTFAQLSKEIYEIGKKYHPDMEMHMIGWWWEAEEHRLFAAWVDEQSPGWVRRMYLHIPYGETTVADVPLPRGCERAAFVHIGYADQASPRDVYGHLGPVIASTRLEKTVHDLAARGCRGVMAYSEGVFDDVNKAILVGLSSGRFRTTDEVLAEYARRYFEADESSATKWVEWLKPWGRPFEVDADAAAKTLDAVLRPTGEPQWRWTQWRLKCELFRWHHQIGRSSEWTAERLEAVDRFWAVQEELHRHVWGLPPLRHIFARRFTPLPWYASWAKYQAEQVGQMAKEQ